MKLSTPTRSLLIAMVVMLLLVVIGDQFGLRTNSKEPLSYVMELDTATIALIQFEDRADPINDLLLERIGQGWEGEAAHERSSDASALAQQLLSRFQSLKVKRDMGMIKLLGERYFLTDSTLCRITFTSSNGMPVALNIGSSTFAPGKVGTWTYVNIPGEREVYSVEGLLTEGLRPDEQAR